MLNEQLLAHIQGELARGVDKTTLIQSLLSAGWKVEDINSAIASVRPAPNQNIPAAPQEPITPMQSAYSIPTASLQTHSIKTLIQNIAAGFFIACVLVLTIVSILGIWSIFSNDVIAKSFETLGILALVAIIVIVASKFVGDPSAEAEPAMPSHGYRSIRNSTLVTLIVSSTLLAFLGVLSIWDVITSTDILHKSLSSLSIIAFSSLIIVMVCLEREQNSFWKKHGREMTGGSVILGIVLIILLANLVF